MPESRCGGTVILPQVAGSRYVPGIDALRAFAVLLVISVHTRVNSLGWTGVWMFFVISGFAITTSLQSMDRTVSDWRSLRHFYIRRCLRIWPLYFGFLLVNILVLLCLHRFGPLRSLPYLASFSYNFEMIFTSDRSRIDWSPFAVLWTLSVEEQFYLVYPFLFLFASRRTTSATLLLIVACAPLLRAILGYLTLHVDWSDRNAYFAVYAFGPAHFDAFAGGALIAMFRDKISVARGKIWLFTGAVMAATAIYFTAYAFLQYKEAGVLSINVLRNIFTGVTVGQGREAFLYTVVWLASACIVMLLLSGQQNVVRLCRIGGAQAIGRVSYGIYVFHVSVAILIGMLLPSLANVQSAPIGLRLIDFGLVTVACYFVAVASWTCIERPFLRLRKFYV